MCLPSASPILGVSDVTRLLEAIDQVDPRASEELLPLVYEVLRRLAAAKLSQERPGQTIQATSHVHEAYLRLVGDDKSSQWDNRWHDFAAAAESMRRIMLNRPRDMHRLKRGGDWHRVDLDQVEVPLGGEIAVEIQQVINAGSANLNVCNQL